MLKHTYVRQIPTLAEMTECAPPSESTCYESGVDRSQVVERGAAIKDLDVLGPRRSETSHGPCELHKMRLERSGERMHADLIREPVGLACIARTARRHDVGPDVETTARERNQMVARERLATLERRLLAAAELTCVAVAREQERVSHLAAELARH